MMKKNISAAKAVSLVLALVLILAASVIAVAEEQTATAIDKEAFDALIASGPVADADAIAASEWATAVKEAGVLRVGGTRTSFLFSQLDETDNGVRGFDAGLYQLLARLEVQTLYLPDIEDEYGVRERLLRLAEKNGIEVVYVRRTVECPLGGAVLSLYPPVGEGDLNEQGLTALCSAGDFDVLITGDMAGSTERKLVGQYDLPDIEVLMVGHHGSRYSSSQELLQAVRPETAIISVGDNSYGHPTQEAMDRLSQAGTEIYRTDRQGNILVTVHGGD